MFWVTRHIEGVKQGKTMTFYFARVPSSTPSGLPVSFVRGSYLTSESFKNESSYRYTSPNEVMLCSDNKQAMHCHLLCGLIQRDEVVSLAAPFACSLVGAITVLENNWKELCSNIRSGHVSEWITDFACREVVTNILGGPNSELADRIEEECQKESWKGIITRLWPKTKFIQSVITGQNAQFIPMLEFYSNKLPLISPIYASSETMFGVNVNPLCKPQDISYTFMPNMSYFEFLRAGDNGNEGDIVDLVDVQIGCYYEPLVTNYFGELYVYTIHDIHIYSIFSKLVI